MKRSKIYKELIKLNTQKINNPVKKWAEDMNRHFSKEDKTNGQQTHEKMLNITCIREVQIKTTMRYHLTSVRMATMNKSGNNRCWQECREVGTLFCCWQECKLVQPIWKTLQRFLKKLKIELPYYPTIALLGTYPKDMKL